MAGKVSIADKIKEIAGKPWSPVDVAQANGQAVRLALFEGEFHWHKHEEDELFYVVKGRITIQRKGELDLVLDAGEVGVIPKGLEHCPKSLKPSYVLMFEPCKLKSEGD